MAIKSYKPTSPGRRFVTSTDFSELSKDGPEPVYDQYRQHSVVLGQTVAIWPDDAADPSDSRLPLHQGKLLEIRPDLSLLIEGVAQPVTEGRLTVIFGQNRNP